MREMAESIYKMPGLPPNYFRYFPIPRAALSWGVAVSAAGRSHIPPGRAYPVGTHPADHVLDWEHGRTLDALQIVLIGAGSGTIEIGTLKPKAVRAGFGFMLLPGTWHRYRPDPETGWSESWVELTGPTVERLVKEGILSAKHPMLTAKKTARCGLEAALERVHARSQAPRGGFDLELAARGFAVLSAWDEATSKSRTQTRLMKIVTSAERILAERASEPVNVAKLARELGVAYSHFRHAFRQHTGYAPWQYVIHLRLVKSKRILAGTDAALDEIASTLGFSSGFHFSAAFKRAFGVSPTRWRKSPGS